MNCKPGDLAVVVRCISAPDTVGNIVRCVRFEPCKGQPAWRIDRPLHASRVVDGFLRMGNWYFDSCLRPIRDNDGEDEMLRIAGKPSGIKEPSHA